MGETAVTAAKAAGYHSTGTVEFLLDGDGHFYFMEMNTRIQVEHPVTEMISGLDLIKDQIRVAMGEPLEWKQSEITLKGHSIECRINAEDPDQQFMPTPGKITSFHVPGGPGIRVDTHVYAGHEVPPYYDSLIAKLIVWGSTRETARAGMIKALESFHVGGVSTTIPVHLKIMKDPGFAAGNYDTGLMERLLN